MTPSATLQVVLAPPSPVMHEKLLGVLASIEKYPVTKVTCNGYIRSQDRALGKDQGHINECFMEKTSELEHIEVRDKYNLIVQKWDYSTHHKLKGDDRFLWRYLENTASWHLGSSPLCETYRSDGTLLSLYMEYEKGDVQRFWWFREDGKRIQEYEMKSFEGGHHKIHYDEEGDVIKEVDERK